MAQSKSKSVLLLCGDFMEDYEVTSFFFSAFSISDFSLHLLLFPSFLCLVPLQTQPIWKFWFFLILTAGDGPISSATRVWGFSGCCLSGEESWRYLSDRCSWVVGSSGLLFSLFVPLVLNFRLLCISPWSLVDKNLVIDLVTDMLPRINGAFLDLLVD